MTIYLDQETFSATPITHGTYRYAETALTEIVTYAFDDGPIQCWDVTLDPRWPEDLLFAIESTDDEIVAHNAMFDRTILRLGSLQRDIPTERWRCTMVCAYAHALPGALDKLCEVLQVSSGEAKLKNGRTLMQLFCKPHKEAKKYGRALVPFGDGTYRATRETHPEQWAEYLVYAQQDIAAMRAVDAKLPRWNTRNADERALWILDQKINDRGICIDAPFAREIVRVVAAEKRRLAKETKDLTGYDAEAGTGLASTTQRDEMLRYLLAEHGVLLPDLQKDTLERRLRDDNLPEELKELLRIRLDATTTSVTKYDALLRAASSDGRLRGTKQFNGAGRTARWAGRIFQPDNLPRPRPGHEPETIAEFIDAVMGDYVDVFTDDVMGFASSSVRGTIIAPPGRKLVIADLANIEGRMAAWLTGEDWKLGAFRDFDAGTGADLYKVAYANAFKISPADVQKHERQIGKVMELMLQYEGGVGAFVTGAATYGIDLTKMADIAWGAIPADVLKEAEGFWDWAVRTNRPTFGLTKKVFVVCDAFKRLWRRAHPSIASSWAELKDAVLAAIAIPGRTFECRRMKVRVDGAWLRIRLPSGRYLCYPRPQANDDAISFLGVDIYTKQWKRVPTHGGKLLENITQAASRDVLGHGMQPAEDAGYEIVLHVHDELVTEAPDEEGFNHDALAEIISRVPPWAVGLPLAAAGFTTKRYYKG